MGPVRRPLREATMNGNTNNASAVSTAKQQEKQLQKRLIATLSRGYLSRGLPKLEPERAVVVGHLGLTEEERATDLRHFESYRNAVIGYRQQYYAAVNHYEGRETNGNALTQPVVGTKSVSKSTVPSLPVKLDPEEEKKLELLRTKILHADFIREQMEQEYVALRAQFVDLAQRLKAQVEVSRTQVLPFLQQSLDARARAVGLLRARLQISRDVAGCLQRRNELLASGAPDSSQHDRATSSSAPSTKEDDLMDLLTRVEEELNTALQSATESGKKSTIVPIPSSKLPYTPFDVPLLLSCSSDAPEKTLAFSTCQAFGAKGESLCWVTSSLHRSGTDDAADNMDDDDNDIDISDINMLTDQVHMLQSELAAERELSQECTRKMVHTRNMHNQWVAMMGLLRQETEAILYRNNILMESDMAISASQKIHEKVLVQRHKDAMLKASEAAQSAASSSQDASNSADLEVPAPADPPLSAAEDMDGENDGDVEDILDGAEEEEEDDDDDDDGGDRRATKRSAEGGPGTSKRRRHI